MLGPIASGTLALAGRHRASRQPRVFFEFEAPGGVADLVVLEFDAVAVEERTTAGLVPVTDYAAAKCVWALRSGPMTSSELADAVRMSAGHLRRSVLRSLTDVGWLRKDGLTWRAARPARPLAVWIVAVEAKRRDWHGALIQASRYQRYANRAVAALDAAADLETAAGHLKSRGIGLVSVNAKNDRVQVLHLPRWHRPASPFGHFLAGELAYSMDTRGMSSGPVRPVFGRTLLATRGHDPRLLDG